MFQSLHMKNVLSFQDVSIDLQPLNVLIGPNASGKSNLIEVISLLQATTRDIPAAIREGGGFGEWLWKGKKSQNAFSIEANIDDPFNDEALKYYIEISSIGQKPTVLEERLEFGSVAEKKKVILEALMGEATVTIKPNEGASPSMGYHFSEPSFLQKIRGPISFEQITKLAERLDNIRVYRGWDTGRNTPLRLPQPADLANDFLDEDAKNLALVLNSLERDSSQIKVEDELRRFYQQFDKLSVQIQGGTVQIYIREKDFRSLIPATRLSDGTLRYLCLLAILCHPEPPPLVCIEEPEIGLHPDILPRVAELLREASTRGQIIVTTHSDILVDALSDTPEAVITCEKSFEGQTEFKRLSKEKLAGWLEDYRLGELWRKGELGATRW